MSSHAFGKFRIVLKYVIGNVGAETDYAFCSYIQLMTEELLQDLVLYRKSHEKAVSASARSLLTLFREVYISLHPL